MIAVILLLAVINGVLYRMGGSGNFPRWTRPVGIGLIAMTVLALTHRADWSWLIVLGIVASGGATAGISTTYFKKKGTDANWFNWLLVGLGLSLALLPFAFVSNDWLHFALRVILLTPAICLWSQFIGNAVVEEFGRGFLTIITLFVFLI